MLGPSAVKCTLSAQPPRQNVRPMVSRVAGPFDGEHGYRRGVGVKVGLHRRV